MNKELEIIKQEALNEHIPILMDDTLEVIIKYLNEIKPNKLLEIGTATRIFINMLRIKYGRK